MDRIPLDQRTKGFTEVELGFSEEAALTEANRCLDCMVCCECLECVKACGAGALTLESHCQQAGQKILDVGAIVLSPDLNPMTLPVWTITDMTVQPMWSRPCSLNVCCPPPAPPRVTW